MRYDIKAARNCGASGPDLVFAPPACVSTCAPRGEKCKFPSSLVDSAPLEPQRVPPRSTDIIRVRDVYRRRLAIFRRLFSFRKAPPGVSRDRDKIASSTATMASMATSTHKSSRSSDGCGGSRFFFSSFNVRDASICNYPKCRRTVAGAPS